MLSVLDGELNVGRERRRWCRFFSPVHRLRQDCNRWIGGLVRLCPSVSAGILAHILFHDINLINPPDRMPAETGGHTSDHSLPSSMQRESSQQQFGPHQEQGGGQQLHPQAHQQAPTPSPYEFAPSGRLGTAGEQSDERYSSEHQRRAPARRYMEDASPTSSGPKGGTPARSHPLTPDVFSHEFRRSQPIGGSGGSLSSRGRHIGPRRGLEEVAEQEQVRLLLRAEQEQEVSHAAGVVGDHDDVQRPPPSSTLAQAARLAKSSSGAPAAPGGGAQTTPYAITITTPAGGTSMSVLDRGSYIEKYKKKRGGSARGEQSTARGGEQSTARGGEQSTARGGEQSARESSSARGVEQAVPQYDKYGLDKHGYIQVPSRVMEYVSHPVHTTGRSTSAQGTGSWGNLSIAKTHTGKHAAATAGAHRHHRGTSRKLSPRVRPGGPKSLSQSPKNVKHGGDLHGVIDHGGGSLSQSPLGEQQGFVRRSVDASLMPPGGTSKSPSSRPEGGASPSARPGFRRSVDASLPGTSKSPSRGPVGAGEASPAAMTVSFPPELAYKPPSSSAAMMDQQFLYPARPEQEVHSFAEHQQSLPAREYQGVQMPQQTAPEVHQDVLQQSEGRGSSLIHRTNEILAGAVDAKPVDRYN